MNQYLVTKTGQYFVVTKIPGDKLIVEAADIQNGVINYTSTAQVKLYRKETLLAIVFLRDSNKYLLTVQGKNAEASLELKEFTNAEVQREDCYFMYEDLGAVDYSGLSTVTTPEMHVYITKESVVGLTIEITDSVPVKEEEA